MKFHRHCFARKCVLLVLFLSAIDTASFFADEIAFTPVRPAIISAKTAGYAGDHSALEAGFDTLGTNPAALAYVTKEWSFSRIAARVSGPLFDIPSVMQSDDIATGILDLVARNKGIYFGANITGPLAFGKVDKNFGFGVFNRSITTADIPSLTNATILAGEEFLLTGGYGITLYEKDKQSIAAGIQLKGFFQTFLMEKGTSLTVLNAFTHFQVNDLPTVLSTGFGLDTGFMYRNGAFNAGLTCKDLYTPVFYDKIYRFYRFQNRKIRIVGCCRPSGSLSVRRHRICLSRSEYLDNTDWLESNGRLSRCIGFIQTGIPKSHPQRKYRYRSRPSGHNQPSRRS